MYDFYCVCKSIIFEYVILFLDEEDVLIVNEKWILENNEWEKKLKE